MLRPLLIAMSVLIMVQAGAAYGHFFGATRQVDNYQIVFQPYPSVPMAGNNSTLLNFSVLQNNTNIFNINSAVVIAKKSGEIVDQIAYKPYEFSDITIPYTFDSPGDYTVTLYTRIADDDKYEANPLVASFEVSAGDPKQLVPFDELMLYYVTPAAVVIAGLAIYLHSKNKI